MPEDAHRAAQGSGSQNPRQLAHESGKDGKPTQRPPLPPKDIRGAHFF